MNYENDNQDYYCLERFVSEQIEVNKIEKIKYLNRPKEDWINKEITDLINLRNSLWRQIKLNPNDNTIRKHYSTVKKEVKTMIRTRKKNYYLSLFQNCSNNPKKTWEVVNSLSLNKTKEKCIPPKLISTSGPVTEGNAICELFNNFLHR
ncbi:unnamed protein product [Euphydryas editha]|uniref:MADF domain-containing protein n=1 Tax=Euphydryas editha TaxID=104508 RepID=A0AAU9TRB6_EUPED|nr:unnamed protein product [Euphydryas editha]